MAPEKIGPQLSLLSGTGDEPVDRGRFRDGRRQFRTQGRSAYPAFDLPCRGLCTVMHRDAQAPLRAFRAFGAADFGFPLRRVRSGMRSLPARSQEPTSELQSLMRISY